MPCLSAKIFKAICKAQGIDPKSVPKFHVKMLYTKEVAAFIRKCHDAENSTANSKLIFKGA